MKNEFPHYLARISWVAGVLVLAVVAVAGQLGAKLVGDLISVGLMSIGAIASIVTLACVPKYGRASLLGPACVGLLINGLLLAIWIPNFFKAQHNAITTQVHEDAGAWPLSRIPGLELQAPLPLTYVDSVAALRRAEKTLQLSPEQIASAEENVKRTQIYSARGPKMSVDITRRLLPPGEAPAMEAQVIKSQS